MLEKADTDTAGSETTAEEDEHQEPKGRNEGRRQLWLDLSGIGLEERRRVIRRQEERERWESFGQYVLDRRLATGQSQSQCAKTAELTQTKWSRIESAEFTVPISAVPGIAAALQLDSVEVYTAAGFAVPENPAKRTRRAVSTDLLMVSRGELAELKEQLDRIERLLLEMTGPSA